MYSFTTTTVINSLTLPNGNPRIVAHSTAGATDGTTVKFGPLILKNQVPVIATVPQAFKRLGRAAVLPEASFAMLPTVANPAAPDPTTEILPGIYRLFVDIELTDLVNSEYANNFTLTPRNIFEVEIEVKSDETLAAEQVAQKFLKAVNTQKRFGHPLVTAETDGAGELTIKGVNPHQVFKVAEIQLYSPVEGVCACDNLCTCSYSKYDAIVSAITDGDPGFGTYEWILKNLRLPTNANTNWLAPYQDERPVIGTIYNQYTVQMIKDGRAIGTEAVGNLVTSTTTHVFFVPQSLSTAFEAAFTNSVTAWTITP